MQPGTTMTILLYIILQPSKIAIQIGSQNSSAVPFDPAKSLFEGNAHLEQSNAEDSADFSVRKV